MVKARLGGRSRFGLSQFSTLAGLRSTERMGASEAIKPPAPTFLRSKPERFFTNASISNVSIWKSNQFYKPELFQMFGALVVPSMAKKLGLRRMFAVGGILFSVGVFV